MFLREGVGKLTTVMSSRTRKSGNSRGAILPHCQSETRENDFETSIMRQQSKAVLLLAMNHIFRSDIWL